MGLAQSTTNNCPYTVWLASSRDQWVECQRARTLDGLLTLAVLLIVAFGAVYVFNAPLADSLLDRAFFGPNGTAVVALIAVVLLLLVWLAGRSAAVDYDRTQATIESGKAAGMSLMNMVSQAQAAQATDAARLFAGAQAVGAGTYLGSMLPTFLGGLSSAFGTSQPQPHALPLPLGYGGGYGGGLGGLSYGY